MKINRHNTAIHFLDEREPLKFGFSMKGNYDPMATGILQARVKDAFPSMRTRCNTGKVQYISDPFEEAYDRAKDRLTLDMDKDIVKQSGVFIFRHKRGGGKNTIFYSMDAHPDKEKGYLMKGSVIAFSTMKHQPIPALFAAYFVDRAAQPLRWYINEEGGSGAFELFVVMFYLCLFLRHCDIETKYIEPGRKGEHVGNKYLNETKTGVEIVDSTWFTNIIRTEGFGVQGHFRLQPYPSLGIKKLIYIAPFEKHGYTRKAKILLNEPERPGQDAERRPNIGLQGHDGGQDGGIGCPAEESTDQGPGA